MLGQTHSDANEERYELVDAYDQKNPHDSSGGRNRHI
jgi:hypothetical protein